MMKLLILFCLSACLVLVSCKNGEQKARNTAGIDTTKFYPMNDFIKSQIEFVDLRSFYIYQKNDLNGVKDSIALTKESFKKIAAIFLEKDISSADKKQHYTETVFHDLSTKSYTLNYRAKDIAEAIQNIDVLLDENTNQVKRIFIRSEFQHNDTSVVEQCNWKADKSFQINRFSKTPAGFKLNEFTYVNWNDQNK